MQKTRSTTPCLGICSTTYGDDVCKGCKRFVHEIMSWPNYAQDESALVNDRLEKFKVLILQDRFKVHDSDLFEIKLKEKAINYNNSMDPLTWIFDLLRAAGSQDLDLEQFGKSLFIDGEIQVASTDEHLYSSTFVGSGLDLNKDNERVAIIGGGDGGVARECVSKNFNFIDWYELDPEVVDVCNKHLGDIGKKATEKNSVKCVWGDAFESIKSVGDDTYDHIFVDLNDDQFCIDLAAKNMESLVRILKPKGVITAQVGSQDKKPQQVENWLNVFNQNFGNAKLARVYIPSFDCSWNFSSSINH